MRHMFEKALNIQTYKLMFPYSTTTSFWFHTIHTSTSISIFGICNFYFHSIKVLKQAFNSEPSYAVHGLVQYLWFNTCHFQSWLHKSGIVLVKSTGDCESVKGFYLLLKSIALRIISLSSSQNRWLPKHTDLKWLSFVFYLHLFSMFSIYLASACHSIHYSPYRYKFGALHVMSYGWFIFYCTSSLF